MLHTEEPSVKKTGLVTIGQKMIINFMISVVYKTDTYQIC